MRTLVLVAALVPCVASAGLAEAHIRLTSPAARYTQDDNGLKTAPCGSGTATGAITALVPGQTLTVTWKESVSHAGHYRIALSANASDFTEPANLTVPTTLPTWDIADGIQDKTGTQTYSQSVQLPNAECPSCVLQLLQIMSAGTDGTNTGTFSGVYHACADVRISASNADAGTARDGAIVMDVRPDVGANNSSDSSAVRMDAVQAAGGATGTGGSGSGGAGTSGSTAGTGGAISAGGSGTGGSGVGAGGAAGNGAGDNGGTVGGSGGMADGTTSASGGSAGGSGGNVSSSGGAGGAGGAASGGSGGSAASSGGVVGSGGNSAMQTASSANGCSCQLGSHSGPGIGLSLSVLALCFRLVRRPRQGDGN